MPTTKPSAAPREIVLRGCTSFHQARCAIDAASDCAGLFVGQRVVTIYGEKYAVTCAADRIVVEVVE